ncbi:MAG: hypothetical protein ACK51Y_03790 [Burkholderiales bacterium]
MHAVDPTLEPRSPGIALALERHAQPGEQTRDQILARVAAALGRTAAQTREFEQALQDGLLPGGRILANAGGHASASTLANCFVHPLQARAQGLHKAILEVGRTLRSGGGVGLDLRAALNNIPINSVLLPFESLACTIESSGGRPAALMGTLPIEHPAAAEFVTLKQHQPLPHFNLSVTVEDEFMRRLRHDPQAIERWAMLARSALSCGDPGVLFIDTIRRNDNLGLQERLDTCNPCGEQPLPAWGACVLASIDLPRLVLDPFMPTARIDQGRLHRLVRCGIALLDQAIDQARFPWPRQTALARSQRRVGLGILGLADALILLGLPYDSAQARRWASELMQSIQVTAWETSLERAQRWGAITACPMNSLLHPGHSASRLPATLQAKIRRHGVRNTHLTSIAPTGMLALAWADNASPGIEPVFAHEGERLQRGTDGQLHPMGVSSPSLRRWRDMESGGDDPARALRVASNRIPAASRARPPAWMTVDEVSPPAQIAMVAALQPWVDGGISKTLALPAQTTADQLALWLRMAWRCGLKGLAVYRPPSWPCG